MPGGFEHLSEPPPSLSRRRGDLPVLVDVVFARAMAKRPGDRFDTGKDFAEALRSALGLTSYGYGGRGVPDPERTGATGSSEGIAWLWEVATRTRVAIGS